MSAAVVPPPTFKDRRVWIIVFGVVEILIGCFVLAMIALGAIAIRFAPKPATAPAFETRFLVMSAVMYGAMALTFVLIGIGNVRLKRWARLVMLAVSWIWLAMGIISTAIMAIALPGIMSATRQNPAQAMPENFDAIFRGVMYGVLGIFFIVLPLLFVLFYSGKNVKGTYENAAGQSGTAAPRKPIAVLIASAWFGLGVFCYLFVFAMPALPLFGFVLRGWKAIAVVTLLEALNIWLALNLYRQRVLAWKVALVMFGFGWVSFLVTLQRMGLEGMYRAMDYNEAQTAMVMPMMRYMLFISGLFAGSFLVLLIATRKHYHDGPVAI